MSEATTAAAAPAQSAPATLAERRTNLAERRQQLAEQREAREGGIDPAAGLDTGGSGLSAKWGPLPVWAWMAIAIGAGALGWFIWKSRSSSSGSSASTTGTSGGSCIDTNGNTVPCAQADYGGEIATLQAEIQDLQGTQQPAPATSTTPPSNIGNNPSNPVPKVTGMLPAAAATALNNQGMAIGTGGKPVAASSLPNKKISSQSPGAGTRIVYGSTYWPSGSSQPFVDVN